MTDKKYPFRLLCKSCDRVFNDGQLLRAPNPFDAEQTVVGCPICKAVDNVTTACDEPGCDKHSECGWPSADGYRWTCHKHAPWESRHD